MILTIFYSWQSDLPNSTNRGVIADCLNKSLKCIYKNNKSISLYVLDTDSRDESGSPDIVDSIFMKIDRCDIFVADVSIINNKSSVRKTPNPNVLIELGYASGVVGWDKILCIFNDDYGQKEDLPFDIRSRKVVGYSTINITNGWKKSFISKLQKSIQEIIDNHLINKQFYLKKKREVDLGLQAILFDFLKFLYFSDNDPIKRLDYNRLLSLEIQNIVDEIQDKEFLGFQLLKNHEQNVSDFKEFFNNNIDMHFFSQKEKNHLAQVILLLQDVKNIFGNMDIYEPIGVSDKYSIISASEMNSENAQNSFILLENIANDKGVVVDSGIFKSHKYDKLLTLYKIKPKYNKNVACSIRNVMTAVNDWIKITGGVFIFNHRQMAPSE